MCVDLRIEIEKYNGRGKRKEIDVYGGMNEGRYPIRVELSFYMEMLLKSCVIRHPIHVHLDKKIRMKQLKIFYSRYLKNKLFVKKIGFKIQNVKK